MHAPDEYEVRACASEEDLRRILALQATNLPDVLDERERREQGFVTLRHDLALLRQMNRPWPHLVAEHAPSGDVVGYALVMLREMRGRIAALAPMFERLDELSAPGGPLDGQRWYVMGQVCVDKAHRGRGLVERMYDGHRAQMGGNFDWMITEIDRANTRSLRVHERAGCEELHSYRSGCGTEGGTEWVIVGLDLGGPRSSADR